MLQLSHCLSCFKSVLPQLANYEKHFIHSSHHLRRAEKLRKGFKPRELNGKKSTKNPPSVSSESVLFAENIETLHDVSEEEILFNRNEVQAELPETRSPSHFSEPAPRTSSKKVVRNYLEEETNSKRSKSKTRPLKTTQLSDSVLFSTNERVRRNDRSKLRESFEGETFEMESQLAFKESVTFSKNREANHESFDGKEAIKPFANDAKTDEINLKSQSCESKPSSTSDKSCPDFSDETEDFVLAEKPHFETSSLTTKRRNPLKPSPIFSTIEDVLDHLARNPNIDAKLYATVFRIIETLIRSGKTKLCTKDIRNREEMKNLSRNVKKDLSSLTVEDAVIIFRTLINLGVSINSELCQDLLLKLSEEIDEVKLESLLSLHRFIVSHSGATTLDRSVKFMTDFPITFEDRIISHSDELDQRTTLFHAVCFAVQQKAVSEKTRKMLIEKFSEQIDQLEPKDAYKMMKLSLTGACRDDLKNIYKKLTDKMNKDIANRSNRQIIGIIHNYIGSHGTQLDDTFLKGTIGRLIQKDSDLTSEEADILLRKLNKINHHCPELLDYLDEQFKNSRFKISEKTISYIRACSYGMYKPQHWNSYKDKLASSISTSEEKYLVRTAYDLLVLQSCPWTLIARCFDRAFLDKYLGRFSDYRSIATMRLQRMNEIVATFHKSEYSGPSLPECFVEEAVNEQRKGMKYFHINCALDRGLGAGPMYVLCGVRTELGQVIDHLIARSKSGEIYPINPLEIVGTCNVPYESLNLPADCNSIAILALPPSAYRFGESVLLGCHQIRLRCLEEKGITPIPIHLSQWLRLQDDERVSYLMKEINGRFSATSTITHPTQDIG